MAFNPWLQVHFYSYKMVGVGSSGWQRALQAGRTLGMFAVSSIVTDLPMPPLADIAKLTGNGMTKLLRHMNVDVVLVGRPGVANR